MTPVVLPVVPLPPLRGGPRLRWGVVGPGHIAAQFVTALRSHTDQPVVAVASRSASRAAEFATRFDILRSYDSLEQLANDPVVDIVYIAGPHSTHAPQALECIAAGKHVLIEKPIAVTVRDAAAVAASASDHGVLAMEALWSAYLPRAAAMKAVLTEGVLGEPLFVSAELGAVFPDSHDHRSQRPELGGGALLDLAVYPLWLARFALGPLALEAAIGSLNPTGVDDQAALLLRSGSRATAAVTVSMRADGPKRGTIGGSAAFIDLEPPFFTPGGFTVRTESGATRWLDTSGLAGNTGLAWQAAAAARFADAGTLDSPVHPLGDAIAALGIITEARRMIGAAGS
jgi:predicted dehydrogenase